MSLFDWFLFLAGLSIGSFVSWLYTTVTHKRKQTRLNIQIAGDHSSQVQIGNINNINSDKPDNDKCRSCIYSRFIETNIAMKELYCYKHSCRCEEIKECSEYSKIGHFLI